MIKKKVIPALKRRGVYENMVFQQDGAPPHCSKVAIEWLTSQFGENKLMSKKSSFQRLQYYSPDLNPLAYYFWGHLKSRVYQHPYPKTVANLKKNNVRESRKISREQISCAINNLNCRLQYVMARKRGYFGQIMNHWVLYQILFQNRIDLRSNLT